jgi:hypothetical protein
VVQGVLDDLVEGWFDPSVPRLFTIDSVGFPRFRGHG